MPSVRSQPPQPMKKVLVPKDSLLPKKTERRAWKAYVFHRLTFAIPPQLEKFAKAHWCAVPNGMVSTAIEYSHESSRSVWWPLASH